MSYREMIQLFEKRRAELVEILKSRSDTIDLSRQHQVYGAIKEIGLFLETLGYYQESLMKEHSDVHKHEMVQSVDKRPFMMKMREALKDKIIKQ